MNAEAQAFVDLLAEERQAAIRADVERLLGIQQEKGEALGKLQASGLAPQLLESLARRARANIALMRHLVATLRAVSLGGEEPTYGQAGERVTHEVGNKRGAL